ncbi:MAG: DNA polymerase III subunit gamma/tau [Deltaproteobacteria bacterium]|nr:DNA polymerase III subunit gamma/tau [Deltaproteobacteria bacterium]
MSYQVLARKYRPQLFAEVIGQIHVTQTLQNALATGRIHHAYLFTGARGIGKTTVARILAKALNCEKGIGSREPCNVCAMCVDILEGRSMDVQEIDGASNNGVEDIRGIREKVKYLSAKGRYKIYIIDEVHMLSAPAFNALLKTLEEPPPHVIFIFATTEVHKIPATILSRCQRYDFKRIPVGELVIDLKKIAESEKVTIDDDALHLVAQEAGGSLRDAQSLFDQAIAYSGETVGYENLKTMLGFLDRTQFWGLLKAVLNRDRKSALEQLHLFYQAGADLNRLAFDMVSGFRNLLLVKTLGDVPDWAELAKEEVRALKEMSALAAPEEIDQLFSLAYAGAEEIARSSFPKMLFDVLLVRMTLIAEVVPLKEILAKLERVAKSGGVGVSSPSVVPTSSVIKEEKSEGKTWDPFLVWLQKENPRLISILNHGRLVSMGAMAIEIGFETGSIYGEMLMEEDRKKQVEAIFLKFFGKPYVLKLVYSTSSSVPLPDETQSRRKILQEAALKHDSVREAANILGAVVEEVRVENKE